PAIPETPQPPAPPTVDKAKVAISVQNGIGTSAPNRAGAVAEELVKQGYTQAVKSTVVPKQTSTTTLIHPASGQEVAKAVAASLGLPDKALQESKQATRLTLVIGTDWKSGTTFGTAGNDGKTATSPPPSSPPAGELPKTADALNASEDGACMEVNQEKDSRGVPLYTW
ncbi:LytR C-terminal domain-containing protein, partial [Streptomyces sp. SID3343]|uniref:LytR C-terminal domain-containing protein n=1 Tax=Streptomyces sp. SID3343 TaxID=2690260 RepID=UPI0013BEF95D